MVLPRATSLQKPAVEPKKLTSEAAHPCTIRLKLCCLAEKYGVSLLQNLAIDSTVSYLKNCSPGFRLKWDILKTWFHYAYQNMHESFGIRRFMSHFFYYALTSSANGNDPNLTQPYRVDEMYDLAGEIPGLNRALFTTSRLTNLRLETGKRGSNHVHLVRNHMRGVRLNCPSSLRPSNTEKPSNSSRTIY